MMRRLLQCGRSWVWLCGCLSITSLGASEYRDHAGLSTELRELSARHEHLVRLERMAWTRGHREVWLLEVGAGQENERKDRPAMLVVAGIEGNDLVGTASVVEWVEQLAADYDRDDSVHRLLESTVLYVFPRVNPDGVESFFARPKLERSTNDRPADDDHDGAVDEDGPEDLNGDGLITSMRVADPAGEFILDPAEPRLLVKADKAKGEKGAWKLLTEGVDNDKDEQWNEDGLGGVNLNRNFPFHYQFFAPWAGPHQVSEPETRAVADFIVAHPNIALAFTFGAADNLVQTPKSEPGGKRPPTLISDADIPFYRELGQAYRDALGLKKELKSEDAPGTLSDWIYFDRGRLSLAARPWTPELQMALAQAVKDAKNEEMKKDAATAPKPEPGDGAKPEAKEKKDQKSASDKRGEEERAVLKWFDENAPETLVPWKEFKHPDFPNQRVEIGGWKPFVRNNPPERFLPALARNHGKFLTALMGKVPRVGFRKVEVRALGSDLFDLTVQVENSGYLPTALAQGALTREVLRTRVLLKLDSKQILAGQRMSLLGPIAGSGGMEEIHYVVRASGPVELEVISALGGSERKTVELKEAQ